MKFVSKHLAAGQKHSTSDVEAGCCCRSPFRADSDLAWVHQGRGSSWIREIASLQWHTSLGLGRV